MNNNVSPSSASLPPEFLARLITELDDEKVRAIILHGSYVRGEAIAPYSDVDIVRILYEGPGSTEHKQFLYRDGRFISVSSRPLSLYRERFSRPEKAIFILPGIREAHILLEKDDAFRTLQQEALSWSWEPLQTAANTYAGQRLVEQTEIVLKMLRALMLHDYIALSDMLHDLFSAITEAVAVQRGVLIRSGNTYFHQVQEAMGSQSLWTHYHLHAAGIDPLSTTIEERGKTALLLYEETARILRPDMSTEHWALVSHALCLIEQALSQKEIR